MFLRPGTIPRRGEKRRQAPPPGLRCSQADYDIASGRMGDYPGHINSSMYSKIYNFTAWNIFCISMIIRSIIPRQEDSGGPVSPGSRFVRQRRAFSRTTFPFFEGTGGNDEKDDRARGPL